MLLPTVGSISTSAVTIDVPPGRREEDPLWKEKNNEYSNEK